MPLVKTHFHDSELFHDLKAMGRDNFSYEGAKALMEYLDDLADQCGENIEYDPIAFCCEYSEYNSALDAAAEYTDVEDLFDDYFDDDDKESACLEYLHHNTCVIEFDGGIIIQDF